MKSLPFLFLILGVLVLPGLEGDENPGVKRRDVRFLDSIFGGSHSSPKDIQVPAQADSSLLESELFCQGPCQDGWVSNMGQCYKFVQEQNTWADAESVCQRIAEGGHLTSISSAAQNDFLVNLASYADKRTTQFWTGGSHQKGTSLRWTDGSLPNFIQRPLSSIFNAIGGIFNHIFNVRICLTLNLRDQNNESSLEGGNRLGCDHTAQQHYEVFKIYLFSHRKKKRRRCIR
ncbi:unnamed protein product [Caretta caretta]